MAYQSALLALADPTRRRVFEELRRGPRAVGSIAARMPVSRPAVSQHLGVLKKAGLVGDRADGTRRIYHIDPKGLAAIRIWLDQFWDDTLLSFQAELEKKEDQADSDRTGAQTTGGQAAVGTPSQRTAPHVKGAM